MSAFLVDAPPVLVVAPDGVRYTRAPVAPMAPADARAELEALAARLCTVANGSIAHDPASAARVIPMALGALEYLRAVGFAVPVVTAVSTDRPTGEG